MQKFMYVLRIDLTGRIVIYRKLQSVKAMEENNAGNKHAGTCGKAEPCIQIIAARNELVGKGCKLCVWPNICRKQAADI